jgi:hypothetical protein
MARDKAEKFVELANKRVSKAIRDLRLIGNLANRRNYDFTDEQARKIVRAIQKETDALRAAFAGRDGGEDEVFKL